MGEILHEDWSIMERVIVSGGFDPIHSGHIDLFKEAYKALGIGREIIVIVNNDNWLMKKKGFVFMPEEERLQIVNAIKYVAGAILSFHSPDDNDMSVARELDAIAYCNPNTKYIFANGGDRKEGCIPTAEEEICKKLGIEMLYNIGGEKTQSSSELVKKASGSCRTILEAK